MDKVSLAGLRILHVHTLPIVSGSGINTLLTMQGSLDCGAEVGLASAPGGKLEMLVGEAGMYFTPSETLSARYLLSRIFTHSGS